jgi:erythromycin esterase
LAHRPAQTYELSAIAHPVIERRLAEDTIWWHEHTGDKIVYWGGMAHMANAATRSVSPPSPPLTHRNAGSYLRERFGPGYLSIGLTFHHGSLPYRVPAPPADFAEAPLGAAGLEAFFLDLRAEGPTWSRPGATRQPGHG